MDVGDRINRAAAARVAIKQAREQGGGTSALVRKLTYQKTQLMRECGVQPPYNQFTLLYILAWDEVMEQSDAILEIDREIVDLKQKLDSKKE